MGLWDRERIGSAVPRLAYEILAADAELLAYYGAGGIGFHGREEARSGSFPPTVPYLAIYGGRSADRRGLGDTGRRDIPVFVVGYHHPLQPCRSNITPPDPPTLGAKAAGQLTGSYMWMLTSVTGAGCSFVKEIPGPGGQIPAKTAATTLASEQITLGISAHGGAGALLWRCAAGGARFRFRAYIAGAGGGTFVDGATGDTAAPDSALSNESAPIRRGVEWITEYQQVVLATREPLTQTGHAQVYKALHFDETADEYVPALNVRRVVLAAYMPTKFKYTDRSAKVDV